MTVILHCEIGDHDWERPTKRGPKPKNCPDHTPYLNVAPSTPEEEERLARKKVAEAERRRRAAEAGRRAKLAAAIRETGRKYPACSCDLNSQTTIKKVATMKGCCDPYYVCGRLDAIRRDFKEEVSEVFASILRKPV